ncbi:hypothetical protein [Flavobacterium cerinum]|uniref:Uncharacterized protein n=1 Tax=Flavobacterium cerinum TaxID=2502784 RepID=A0ABY5INT7_9FLAO|nr:hypothetical protein [Flavobacterium cerinum]UUC44409.1 hypothetical protein NOX80_12285 [Flavobacterium cerinum]
MKNRTPLPYFPTFILILIALLSCEIENDVIQKNDYKEKVKIRQSTFDQLLKEQTFVAAFSKFSKQKDRGTQSKTVMEAEYGFTIVPNMAKIIESGHNTSYTFKITRQINNPEYFENLVINVDSLSEITAYILKYIPSEPLTPSGIHESFRFEGTVSITPIVYNSSEMSKTTICVTAQILMCDEAWSPTNTGIHVATNDCKNQNHLFYSSVRTCYTTDGDIGGGDFGDDPVVIAPIGGGGGDPPTDGSPPNNCPRCPVIVTSPVEEWVEPPLHCERLNELFKSYNFKEAIKYLKTPQVLDGVKEQGYNLTLNGKGNLVVTAVPEANTGENNVNYSATSPFLFGGLHCHRNIHAPMFSHSDIFILTKFYTQHNYAGNQGIPDPKIPVHLLVTYQGVYALSMDNQSTVQKLQDIYSNKDKRKKFMNELQKRYDKFGDKNTLHPAGYALDYQRTLLDFLNENGLEISLYKADDNLTKWTKLALNDNPETKTNKPINEINCN